MKVSEAVSARRSIRAFTKKPIDNSLIESLLKQSSFAPSGGNLQPWRIYVLNKDSMTSFLEFQETWDMPEKPGYDIYPPNLKEPYRTSRYKVGEAMYALLGIPREDKDSRMQQVLRNFSFFDAPAAIFCFVDKQMGPPQWSDLGMFLQTFMLLAQEVGIDTCAQEAWAMKSKCVSKFVGASNDEMLFCGLAIGYRDTNSAVNQLKTDRMPLDTWATFL